MGKAGVPDRENLESLFMHHFRHLTIFKLKISPKKDIEDWILSNGDTMLVAGAYGRSLFSEMLKKSFISEVINDNKIPVFVAHK